MHCLHLQQRQQLMKPQGINMTTAEKAKEAVLERVIELAKTAEITDLFVLTDTISHATGESTQHLATLPDMLLKIMV